MSKIHPEIKKALGFKENIDDDDFMAAVGDKSETGKPCWTLLYCPYGPLVEEFPLLPLILSDVVSHNDYLQKCLDTGILGNGESVDPGRQEIFQQELDGFDPDEYPDDVPESIAQMACEVFGHICPVYFVAEPLAEEPKPSDN